MEFDASPWGGRAILRTSQVIVEWFAMEWLAYGVVHLSVLPADPRHQTIWEVTTFLIGLDCLGVALLQNLASGFGRQCRCSVRRLRLARQGQQVGRRAGVVVASVPPRLVLRGGPSARRSKSFGGRTVEAGCTQHGSCFVAGSFGRGSGNIWKIQL